MNARFKRALVDKISKILLEFHEEAAGLPASIHKERADFYSERIIGVSQSVNAEFEPKGSRTVLEEW